MQFFERAQSDVHERSATARHPLFNIKLYGTYVWSHGYIGFFMLIAANGITEVYYIVSGRVALMTMVGVDCFVCWFHRLQAVTRRLRTSRSSWSTSR